VSKILTKVRALIDKAESTEHEAERDAFLAKAQQMMEEHAITQAEIEMAKPSQVREPISVRVEYGTGVGKGALGSLAVTLARANRCQVVSYSNYRGSRYMQLGVTFQGMPEDVEFCEMLFTSLRLQAEQALQLSLKLGKKPEWTHGRTYRNSFMEGYFDRVRNRIKEQANQRESERMSSEGGHTALVLANVQGRIEEKFGKVSYGTRRTHIGCDAGHSDGGYHGARADISGGRTKQISSRKALKA
jgi:hypothetical protein